jgi:ligand-binding sensor domain-containing protein
MIGDTLLLVLLVVIPLLALAVVAIKFSLYFFDDLTEEEKKDVCDSLINNINRPHYD